MITTEIELLPFSVPNYVLVKFGVSDNGKFHLSEVSTETLEALCKQFRENVLAKAAKGPL